MQLGLVGIIGDVHAQSKRLEAALRFLREKRVQQILCVGDVVDGGGDVEQCCRLLEDNQVALVRGNHDRWILEGAMRDLPTAIWLEELNERSQAFIEALPVTQSFETTRGKLLLCHGLGENDMRRLTSDDYGYALQSNTELQTLITEREFRFVVGGHTHRRMVRHFDGLTVINAGTLYDAHEPCVCLADFENGVITFHDFVGDDIEMKADETMDKVLCRV